MGGADLTVIGDLEGFTPGIARLVCMMQCVRRSVLREVQGLTQEQLDHRHDAESNSIGALLHHIASVEWYYQVVTIEGREPTADEEREWRPAFSSELADAGRRELRGRSLTFYDRLLGRVRARTLDGLRARDDAWLEAERRWGDRPVNFYWMWFHAFEDELNHGGQIRWLKRRLPQAG